MKGDFRKSMKWLHTWVGLVVGWVLFFMFITGTTGYFYKEITRWMQPERPLILHEISNEALLDIGQAYLNKHAKESTEWNIYLPNRRDQNLRVGWREKPEAGKKRGRFVTKILAVNNGVAVATRDTGGGRLLYRMHYRLHYLSTKISYWIVGFCSMLMLLAVITGVVIHKKIFTDFFTFRAKKGLLGWLDIHNVFSVIALPFHFMITYSGLLFFLFTYMVLSTNIQTSELEFDEMRAEIYPRATKVEPANIPAAMQKFSSLHKQTTAIWPSDTLEQVKIHAANDINANVVFVRTETDITYNHNDALRFNGVTGELLTVPEREYTVAGSIQNGFFSLHEGQFAGVIARWIYVITGLVGSAMIASGLILWTTKRKPQQMKKNTGPDFGYRLVEQLNIGTLVGLPIAIALYFYANRLLPVAFENRAAWEANTMFISWALLLIYPAFRPSAKAWAEQLQLAACVFGFIPLLNLLTTDKHLGVTLVHGDWGYAGFDLTMLFIGLSFAFAGYKFKQLRDKKSKVKRDNATIAPDSSKGLNSTLEITLNQQKARAL
jgi:uncharacterized iron-regulated membrane protein